MLFAKVVWAAGEIKPIGTPDGNFEKDDKKIYINLINLDAGLQWFSVRFVREADVHPMMERRNAANDRIVRTAVIQPRFRCRSAANGGSVPKAVVQAIKTIGYRCLFGNAHFLMLCLERLIAVR